MAASFGTSIYNFLSRNRRKFIFAGVFFGGAYGISKFAEWKVRGWIELEREKVLNERQKSDHFQTTEAQCYAIIKSVVDAFSDELAKEFDTDAILSKIKSENTQELKIAHWNELKVAVFAKLISTGILVSYSAVILGVQLHQISAHVFKAMNSNERHIDDRIQRWYLALVHDFVLKYGMSQFLPLIKKIIYNLVNTMPLQCPMSPANIENVLKSAEIKIKEIGLTSSQTDNTSYSICAFMFPLEDTIDYGNHKSEITVKLSNEMWDIVESSDFKNCIEQTIALCFNNISDLIANLIWPTVVKEIEFSHKNVCPHSTIPLAKLLPILNKNLSSICSASFLKKLLSESVLCDLRANVFESFVE